MRNVLPVLTVLLVIVGIWYAAAIWMNSAWTLDRADGPLTFSEIVTDTMSQDRPRLPAPHQVWAEFRKTVFDTKVTSKRSLVFHGWITLSSTLAGFALGTLTGILMAVGIVYSRPVSMSLMPWAIISQTIPIVALAPMIIVVLASLGVDGRAVPKAIISAYLCYFPVLVGMVKGLKSPDAMQLDLMKTWSATGWQSFWRLRFPSSVPYLFTSLKVGIAAALVGTIVGELPTGAVRGLGARILIGDQFGNPMMIWSALIAAAVLAGVLVTVVSLMQTAAMKRMGFAR
ncbi:ABC transporter permease [Psychromarinibacter halotolerans]|uniref:ABC transporter permease n=1 Tax=Psychromarinibacter halotolerans TaxID=1775175 RepID=A0ABV7H235_9RHOB|nr:ABC transporter permease [Psychromarinibacter halotolerans]MAQ84800.1 ABC transporter permease [Maritimibacter sp.]MDF0596160.1 ABC transporter permease [Psychromarinibacter halotolerans]